MKFLFQTWKTVLIDDVAKKQLQIIELQEKLINDDATIYEFVSAFLDIGIVPTFAFSDIRNYPILDEHNQLNMLHGKNAEYDFNADKAIFNAESEKKLSISNKKKLAKTVKK